MPKEQTGITGEFWFFSQLHRLGYEAYITLGNTKSIDLCLNLNNGTILTFDVKSKLQFGGSFQYLNIPKRKNHFAVFVDLKARKNKSGVVELFGEPTCYIVKSEDLDNIAFHWTSEKGSTGYGFEDKLLWYLKHQDNKSITAKNIHDFKYRHQLTGDLNFPFYDKIICTLADFENQYFMLK